MNENREGWDGGKGSERWGEERGARVKSLKRQGVKEEEAGGWSVVGQGAGCRVQG